MKKEEIKEIIKEYLKENLKVEIIIDNTVSVANVWVCIHLDGELITSHSDFFNT